MPSGAANLVALGGRLTSTLQIRGAPGATVAITARLLTAGRGAAVPSAGASLAALSGRIGGMLKGAAGIAGAVAAAGRVAIKIWGRGRLSGPVGPQLEIDPRRFSHEMPRRTAMNESNRDLSGNADRRISGNAG